MFLGLWNQFPPSDNAAAPIESSKKPISTNVMNVTLLVFCPAHLNSIKAILYGRARFQSIFRLKRPSKIYRIGVIIAF